MGSYKWGYKSLTWVISRVTLLITPLITTHEPPSSTQGKKKNVAKRPASLPRNFAPLAGPAPHGLPRDLRLYLGFRFFFKLLFNVCLGFRV